MRTALAHPQPSKGFTIIELMVVVAIVSILAVMALPIYQDYVIRSRVTEGLVFVAEAKTTVSERFYTTRSMPKSNEEAGLKEKSEYGVIKNIQTLEVSSLPNHKDGTIIVTFNIPGSAAHDRQLQLIPSTQTGEINWTCKPTDPPDGLKTSQAPPNCRG